MNVVLFDVCHTLFDANTTYDFLAHYFPNDERMQRLLKRRHSLWGRIRAKFGEEEQIQRLKAISLLEGESRSSLESGARVFVESLKEIEPVVSMLNAAKAEGKKIALVSSSLDVVVAAVAARLGVDEFYASSLLFDGEICRGELGEDLLGNKAGLIDQAFSSDHTTFVTDNFSDADCVDVVNKLYPVYKKGNLRAETFWRQRALGPPICYE